MLKNLILCVLLFASVAEGWSQVKIYGFRFDLAFHSGLKVDLLKTENDSYEMAIQQLPLYLSVNGDWPRDSYVYQKHRPRVFGIQELEQFDFPVFNVTVKLKKSEWSELFDILTKLDSFVLHHVHEGGPGLDGYSVKYENMLHEDSVKYRWYLPKGDTELGQTLLKVLDYIEKRAKNYIVNTAIDDIHRYLKPENYPFKIVSLTPFYVKLLNTPCCSCAKMERVVAMAPTKEQVYIDITNYVGADKSCIVESFQKHFERIAWITDERRLESYSKLMGK
ncbi:MAG: hypothetical protein JJU02_01570 [Cryomorphaceae bacterium]|nr:hypothetical protein [Cryomorphaceae bacterium]